MKKLTTIVLVFFALAANVKLTSAQEKIKTGYNFGPLPAIAFDADKGFQYGALLQLYNYGDGSSYPNYKSKWYFEASWFTKGSQQYNVMYDNMNLWNNVRLCASVKYVLDSSFDFYGFNGYQSNYDETGDAFRSATLDGGVPGDILHNETPFHPFYRLKKNTLLARADLLGKITPQLHWEFGYHFMNFDQGTIDYDSINKGKDESVQYPKSYGTLLDYYTAWGIIPESEKNGGNYSCVRFGMEYDTRDKEGAPASGIWAEAHVNLAPKWLGSSSSSYRYSATWRQYFPIIDNDVLTFAYRLNYEGTFGNTCPYYVLPYCSVIGSDIDVDGMGGSKTTRGIMRARIVGLDTAIYNAELRWRFTQFQLWNQNIAFGLSCFSDGAMVVRPYKLEFKPVNELGNSTKNLYETMVKDDVKDTPHVSCGGGLRFIMNQNFIVACEYGVPVSKFYSNSNPLKGQDGNGALYINLGYLF